ncbi:MAG: hypothetical protein K2I96_00035 [Lachnospiraceae bacterium]|nr:hypothetical protein [Lachnospiraceae bacterium]
MRKSHKGISSGLIKKDNYNGLPTELDEFNYYYNDGDTGHVIMAVPESLLAEAEINGNLDMFECPVPCRYILEHGYKLCKNHVIVDVPYGMFGIDIDERYYEI